MSEKAEEARKVEISVLETERQVKNAVIIGLTERLSNYSPLAWGEWVHKSDAKNRLFALFELFNECNKGLKEETTKQGKDETKSFGDGHLAYVVAREEAKRCLEIYKGGVGTYFEEEEINQQEKDSLDTLFDRIYKEAETLETSDDRAKEAVLGGIRKIRGVFRDLTGFAEEGKVIPLIWPLMYEKPVFDFTQPNSVLSLWSLEGKFLAG